MEGWLQAVFGAVLSLVLSESVRALRMSGSSSGGELPGRRGMRRVGGRRTRRPFSYEESLGIIVVLAAPIAVTLVGVLVGATPLTMGLAAAAAVFWQQSAVLSGEDAAVALPTALAVTSGFSLVVIAVTGVSQQL
jgi:hypothetical protein